MKYFVSSDIHGFYNEWKNALKEKGFDILNSNHKIILCGDLFDRGRQPKQIIDFILNNKNKFIIIKGNHEDLIEDLIERNQSTIYDLHNGTSTTIVDLCPEWLITEFDLKKISKQTGLNEILSMCQNYFETDNYIFVHGWIPIDNYINQYDPNWRNASSDAWKKARWANPLEMYKSKIFEPNKTIVCGHWHSSVFWSYFEPEKHTEFGESSKFDTFITDKMIALDACTAYSRKVNVVMIED